MPEPREMTAEELEALSNVANKAWNAGPADEHESLWLPRVAAEVAVAARAMDEARGCDLDDKTLASIRRLVATGTRPSEDRRDYAIRDLLNALAQKGRTITALTARAERAEEVLRLKTEEAEHFAKSWHEAVEEAGRRRDAALEEAKGVIFSAVDAGEMKMAVGGPIASRIDARKSSPAEPMVPVAKVRDVLRRVGRDVYTAPIPYVIGKAAEDLGVVLDDGPAP